MIIGNKKRTVITVCHDAGGAEIISAYVKANNSKAKFVCLALGPARKIFLRKKLGDLLISKKFDAEIIFKKFLPDFLLTGTSWASGIEFKYVKQAKKLGVKTAVYLDHWTNYRERFGYPRLGWENNLPEEIWVGDKYALELAKRKFIGKIKLRLVENLYFKEVKKQYRNLTLKKYQVKKYQADNILFLGEPLSSAINIFGDRKKIKYNEFVILDQLLSFLSRNYFKKSVVVRLHPSESRDKYDNVLNKYKNKIKIIKSKEKNLLNDLADCDLTVGMQSMALVISAICGKKTVSFLPDEKQKCILPFSAIIKIKKISLLKNLLKTA